ncbi:hypothetical protein PIB30_055384 [Stylosanthes scabra]|uniref:Uncharacterized protein n=1 Tax=Stylosanthes scabra TaxID=79078 RepID=A0ABU6TIW6_9FABA|nr:hypothetical protein [Stylosanthes scabra]
MASDMKRVITEKGNESHAMLGEEVVINLGQMAPNPHFEGLQRSTRMRSNNKMLELIGIEKGIRKAKEGIKEQKVHKRKPKSGKQGTVRSHDPVMRPHVSLGAFWDAFCQYSCNHTVLPATVWVQSQSCNFH